MTAPNNDSINLPGPTTSEREAYRAERQKSNYEDLRIAASSGKLAIIYGAGVTINAVGKIPHLQWDGMVKDALGYMDPVTKEQEFRVKNAFETTSDGRGGPKALLDAATTAQHLLQETQIFANWLEYRFARDKLPVTSPAILDAIWSLYNAGSGNMLITTNYDHVLEDHIPRLRTIRRGYADGIERWRRNPDGVLHIHGDWEHPEDVVLGLVDYHKVIHNEAVQDVLATCFKDKTILFIGCGGTLGDPNFEHLLSWASETLRNIPWHHVLAQLKDEESVNAKLYPRLMRLDYGSNHNELAAWVEGLSRIHSASVPDTLQSVNRESQDLSIENMSVSRESRHRLSTIPERPFDIGLYVGGEEALTQISTMCSESSAEVPTRLIIYADRGQGKTRLAYEFATKQFAACCRHVFWVVADSLQSLEHSYRRIAGKAELSLSPQADITEVLRSVTHWLTHFAGEWLLVLDDASHETFYSQMANGSRTCDLIPLGINSGCLLITTADGRLAHRLRENNHFRRVRCSLGIESARNLMQLRSKDTVTSDAIVDEVLAILGNNPSLIIALSCCILELIGGTIASFDRENLLEVLKKSCGTRDINGGLYQNAVIKWGSLISDKNILGDDTHDTFMVLCCLASVGIPTSLIQECIQPPSRASMDRRQCLKRLENHFLISYDYELKTVNMQRLVRDVGRDWLHSSSTRQDIYITAFRACMIKLCKIHRLHGYKFSGYIEKCQLMSHADIFRKYCLSEWCDIDLDADRAELMYALAYYYSEMGLFWSDENWTDYAISLFRGLLHQYHTKDMLKFRIMRDCAMALADARHLKPASDLLREALDCEWPLCDEEERGWLKCEALSALAWLYSDRSVYEMNGTIYQNALRFQERLIKLKTETSGSQNDLEVLEARLDLSIMQFIRPSTSPSGTYRDQGLSGVEKHQRELLEALLSSLDGERKVLRLAVQAALTRTLYSQHKYKEALELVEQVFHERSKMLGTLHHKTLGSQQDLGMCLLACGRPEEAGVQLDEAHRILNDALGSSHEAVRECNDKAASAKKAMNGNCSYLTHPSLLTNGRSRRVAATNKPIWLVIYPRIDNSHRFRNSDQDDCASQSSNSPVSGID